MNLLSDQDLIARLAFLEDSFVERKPLRNKGDYLKTTVAFANSTPIGQPAVLFLGVADDGTVSDNKDVEDAMKSYSDFIAEHVYTNQRVLSQGGRTFIAVIIPGSEHRPHFAGKAYVRDGTQTREASEDQFARLIAERESKARVILGWKGKTIYLKLFPRNSSAAQIQQVKVQDCNSLFVELALLSGGSDSYPLARIDLGKEIIFYNE